MLNTCSLFSFFTFHRLFAKFFFSCSDTELWMLRSLAALPEILWDKTDNHTITMYVHQYHHYLFLEEVRN